MLSKKDAKLMKKYFADLYGKEYLKAAEKYPYAPLRTSQDIDDESIDLDGPAQDAIDRGLPVPKHSQAYEAIQRLKKRGRKRIS